MAVLRVGPGAEYPELGLAVAAAEPDDEIQVVGSMDVAAPVFTNRPLRFVGLGVRPVLTLRGLCASGVGLLTTHGGTQVHNLEFRRARALTGNGAGVWHTGGDLELVDCVFADNQNGVMFAAGAEDGARVSGCSFVSNGAGCGHTHGIYATSGGWLEVDRCHFEDTWVGHHVKARVATTSVTRNYFGGSPAATTSYAVDIANGGVAEIAQNLFIKGRGSMSRKFVAYCPETRRFAENRLLVTSNIFISHRRGRSVAVVNFAASVPAVLQQNAYEGKMLALLGRGRDARREAPGAAITRGAAAARVG